MSATIDLPAEHANIIFDALIDSRCFSRKASSLPGADLGYWTEQMRRIDAAYAALTVAKMGLQSSPSPSPTAIGEAFAGGIYAGITPGVDGAPGRHLVLLPCEAVDVDWEAAGAFAASVGGELPTRAEQALLFANLKDQFEPHWYWSSEQAGPSLAWVQLFSFGFQGYDFRSYEGRARAVRSFSI